MPTFTADWFSNHIPTWELHLKHLAGTPCQLLEIGCFEGRASVWLAQHLLGDPSSHLSCMDNNSSGGKPIWKANIDELPMRLQVHYYEGDSQFLLPFHYQKFQKMDREQQAELGLDLIYIDGDHHGRSVILDGCNAWPLLKSGGILIFDDYHWKHATYPPHAQPGPAIDFFLALYRDQLEILHQGWQVIVRKR